MPCYKIVVDPGHFAGCPNKGPTDYYEYAGMWKLSNLLKEALEGRGCSVVLTRGENENPSLTARGAKAGGADLFISEHSNAANGAARGAEVYYSIRRPEDKGLADTLSKAIASIMDNPNRGGKTRASTNDSTSDYYTVISSAEKTGCAHILLAESGFHDNPIDEAFLKSDENLKKLAHAQAEVIYGALALALDANARQSGNAELSLTSITGEAAASTSQMTAYIKAKNPSVPQSVIDMIPLYLSEGGLEGVRGDIAFAQSCLETGNFTFKNSAVTLKQNNFCGMGVTRNGISGSTFNTPREGIRAQIHHLKAYANETALTVTPTPDTRFSLVKRGCAPFVEWLGQKENPEGMGWATGAGYGEKILNILSGVLETPDNAAPSSWAKDAWAWARENKVTDGTNPLLPASREQTAQMMFNFWKAFIRG